MLASFILTSLLIFTLHSFQLALAEPAQINLYYMGTTKEFDHTHLFPITNTDETLKVKLNQTKSSESIDAFLNLSLSEQQPHSQGLLEKYQLEGDQYLKPNSITNTMEPSNTTGQNQTNSSILWVQSQKIKQLMNYCLVIQFIKLYFLSARIKPKSNLKSFGLEEMTVGQIIWLSFFLRIFFSIHPQILIFILSGTYFFLRNEIENSRKQRMFRRILMVISLVFPFKAMIWILALLPVFQLNPHRCTRAKIFTRMYLNQINLLNTNLIYILTQFTTFFSLNSTQSFLIKLLAVALTLANFLKLQFVCSQRPKYLQDIDLSSPALKQEICAICLNQLTDQAYVENIRTVNNRRVGTIMKTHCSHRFHSSCLTKWMKRRRTCPLDNRSIEEWFHDC